VASGVQDEAAQQANTPSDGAVGTSFLSLLEGSLASTPIDKHGGAGTGEEGTGRGAADEGHAQGEEDEGRPLSFSLGHSRWSKLDSARFASGVKHVATRGWLSSSSSSSSPDKGRSRAPGTPAYSTARPSAVTARFPSQGACAQSLKGQPCWGYPRGISCWVAEGSWPPGEGC